jgi:hypothetical protein
MILAATVEGRCRLLADFVAEIGDHNSEVADAIF